MTEEKKETLITQEERAKTLIDSFIRFQGSNVEVKKFIDKKYIKRITKSTTILLLNAVFIENTFPLNYKQIKMSSTVYERSKKYFDDDGNFKIEFLREFKTIVGDYLVKLGRDLGEYKSQQDKGPKLVSIGGGLYELKKEIIYDKIRNKTCEEDGDVTFKYNFDEPDIEITIPETTQTLQRCLIQVLSKETRFGYPVEFNYVCPECLLRFTKKAHETISTNDRVRCEGLVPTATGDSVKRCNTSLSPDKKTSRTKDTFLYRISYDNESDDKIIANASSFIDIRPGFYECVLYKLGNPGTTEEYQIMDVNDVGSNPFTLPPKIPGENYLFTLQKAFDSFVKRQTGVEIWGLAQMKVSLILQCLMSHLKFDLVGNVQLVGDASTGKSLLLKYYGFLLYNHLNLSTNGLSVSIAGLRGTKQTVTLMGRDYKIVTTGHLGIFRAIHIDEAGENKELVQNLKTFLLEKNYSYDKAGATGAFNIRIAHVNISENLDHQHVGQYRGAIRKAYKDMTVTIEGTDKEHWDEQWDLHQPLYMYDNPYLRKIVKDKRMEYIQKKLFWLDGYDYALHERFPFYFYLVNEKENLPLSDVVMENAKRNSISENTELMRQLRADTIEQFFKGLIKYKKGTNDGEGFIRVSQMLKNYGLEADERTKKIYYWILMLSRIINRRLTLEEEDFHLVQWMIESTNRKIDVVDTNAYIIKGPPDIEAHKAKDREIEDRMIDIEGQFGLPTDEFD